MPNVKPQIKFNSYSESNHTPASDSTSHSDERSMRHGPPYDEDVDDIEVLIDREKLLNRTTRYRDELDDRFDQYDRDYYNRNRDRYRDRNQDGRYDDRLDFDRYPNDRERYNNDRERYPINDRDRYNDDRHRYTGDRGNSERDRYPNTRYNNDDDRYRERTPYFVSEKERERNNNPYNRPYNNNDDNNNRDHNNPRYGPYPFNERDRYNDQNFYYNIENDPKYQEEMRRLKDLLDNIDRKSSLECSQNVAAQWNFETNVNEETHLAAVSKSFWSKFWILSQRTDEVQTINSVFLENPLGRQKKPMGEISLFPC